MGEGVKKKPEKVRAFALKYINTPHGFNIYRIFESKKDALFEASKDKYLYNIKSPSDVVVEVLITPKKSNRAK